MPLTRRQIVRRFWLSAALATILGMSAYCDWRHSCDRRWLATVARKVVAETGSHGIRAQAIALRDFVRRRVKFQGAPHDDRPFLRATARETLESGLGYCGESSRALVKLLSELGIQSQRVNLYNPLSHVVVEVKLEDGRRILIDPQYNPEFNKYFDREDLTVEMLTQRPDSPFREYSNLNLKRLPVLGRYIQGVKLEMSWLNWAQESPWFIIGTTLQLIAAVLILIYAIDRILVRLYARRLGRGWRSFTPYNHRTSMDGPILTTLLGSRPGAK